MRGPWYKFQRTVTKTKILLILQEQTFDLMYCQPEADEDGEVRPKKYGGRRRIDRILTDQPAKIEGYQFLTCLAGQTDHVPVAMTIKC